MSAETFANIRTLCLEVQLQFWEPDRLIVRQGDVAASCFVVVSGSVDVYVFRDVAKPHLKEHSIFPRKKPTEPVPLGIAAATDLPSLVADLAADMRMERAKIGGHTEDFPAEYMRRRSVQVMSEDVSRRMFAELHPGRAIPDRRVLGEYVTTMDEGDVVGDLALIHRSRKRLASVVANGRFDAHACDFHMDTTMDEAEDTVLLEIPREGSDGTALLMQRLRVAGWNHTPLW
jgi:CRP-like cAMP-binding protein